MDFEAVLDTFTIHINTLNETLKLLSPIMRDNFMKGLENNKLMSTVLGAFDKKDEDLKEVKLKLDYTEELPENFTFTTEFVETGIRFDFEEGIEVPLELKDEINSMNVYSHQIFLVNEATLMNLIIYFENLVSNLFSMILFKYPEKINLNKKVVEFSEIERLKDVESIKEMLIANEVEKIMRKNFVEWTKELKKICNCKFEIFDAYMDEIIEVFQIRNIVVHNNGIINRQYINSVKSTTYNEGEKLEIEEEFLISKINLLEEVGIKIGIEIWMKYVKEDLRRNNYFLHKAKKLIEKKRFEICEIYIRNIDDSLLRTKDRDNLNKLKSLIEKNL